MQNVLIALFILSLFLSDVYVPLMNTSHSNTYH